MNASIHADLSTTLTELITRHKSICIGNNFYRIVERFLGTSNCVARMDAFDSQVKVWIILW